MADATLETLTNDECLERLRQNSVGRVAVVIDAFPVVLPVNYRLAETSARSWIALRTRPGNVLDRAPFQAAFEIDEIDPSHHEGWSVLVRGTLHRVDPESADFRGRFDPEPWILEERDRWLVIEPFSITGRRLRAGEPAWAFTDRAYL